MREGLGELLEILSWSRPHGSEAEAQFVERHVIRPICDAGIVPSVDAFGNVWAFVPPAPDGDLRSPSFLWSCHVDTVAAKGGRQAVEFGPDGRTLKLVKQKPGRCLGADDGAGVWLLLRMLRAGVPGGYVFHRGEEVGRLGSTYVADHEPERLKGFDACVAFDRRDFSDLITHQMGRRCASEGFADTFGAAINRAGRGLRYQADPTGSYTDSYSYADLVSECANVSVGYDSEHGPRETLDGLHLWRLAEAMVSADLSGVVCERDPSTLEWDDWRGGYGGGYTFGYPSGSSPRWGASGSGSRTGDNAWRGSLVDDDADDQGEDGGNLASPDLVALCERFPEAVAFLLESYGLGTEDVLDVLSPSALGEAMRVCSGGGGWDHD
jgi:hypothetical protein